jgi:UDP-N-acetylmuramoylalanine--D-glutamate ligase
MGHPDGRPQVSETPHVLVYGLGRSGSSVIRHLNKLGWRGAWFDRSETPFGAESALTLGFPRVTEINPSNFTLCVAAPGVMFQSSELRALRDAGLETIGEVELAYRTVQPPVPTIGVTGTAGKGSTTLLIAQLLESQGLKARVGGNFDPPLLDVIHDCEIAVVELSSFQLERIVSYRPEVAVITNMGVDHIRDHGSLEAYHAAKWMIAKNLQAEDSLVLPESLKLGRNTPARMARVLETGDVMAGVETLIAHTKIPTTIHPMNARIAVRATIEYLQRVGKKPNFEALRRALLEFPGVPGRFETVATLRGTRFIDDSIATRVLAVQAALENAPAPIAWILGGRDKLTELEHETELPKLAVLVKERVAVLFAFGESGLEYAKYFQSLGVRIVDLTKLSGTDALETAVRQGFEIVQHYTSEAKGSVVLAPLGTSFDLFKDYKARGHAFREAVQRLTTDREAEALEHPSLEIHTAQGDR